MSKYQKLWEYVKNCGSDVVTLRFAEIADIAGVAVEHSLLKYKKELPEYGYEVGRISLKGQTVEFRRIQSDKINKSDTLVWYVHGRGGTAAEAGHYKVLFPDCDVVGFDYRAGTPWEAKEEFPAALCEAAAGYRRVILIANSIGAYFAICALPQERIERAYFISPVVDMEKLIGNMMVWANVTEGELREKGEIDTAFGERLSWEYLGWVRENPVSWQVATEILYGGRDNLTDRETITAFAGKFGAGLTVMESGEHWFHTVEQMKFLDDWLLDVKNR